MVLSKPKRDAVRDLAALKIFTKEIKQNAELKTLVSKLGRPYVEELIDSFQRNDLENAFTIIHSVGEKFLKVTRKNGNMNMSPSQKKREIKFGMRSRIGKRQNPVGSLGQPGNLPQPLPMTQPSAPNPPYPDFQLDAQVVIADLESNYTQNGAFGAREKIIESVFPYPRLSVPQYLQTYLEDLFKNHRAYNSPNPPHPNPYYYTRDAFDHNNRKILPLTKLEQLITHMLRVKDTDIDFIQRTAALFHRIEILTMSCLL